MQKINAANGNYMVQNPDGTMHQLFDIDCIAIHIQKKKLAEKDASAAKMVPLLSHKVMVDIAAGKATNAKGETLKLICPKDASEVEPRYLRRRCPLSQKALGDHQFALEISGMK